MILIRSFGASLGLAFGCLILAMVVAMNAITRSLEVD